MQETIILYLSNHIYELIWIAVLFFCGKIILAFTINRLVHFADDGNDESISKNEKRAKTLGHIIKSIGNVCIYSIILFMILNLFGVDLRPVLASAGIIGLAVGFGAQSLIKDFVSGLLIMIENQYGIGDTIKIGEYEGQVISISMRSTVIVDNKKNLYYISNGSIKDVINKSQYK